MLWRGLLIFTALSLVVVNSPSARADLCFRYTVSGGGTHVLQGATLPAPNTCQPVAMYEVGGLAGAGTGSICQDGFGDSTLVFHYTFDGCTGNYFESGTCRFTLPADGSLPTLGSTCRVTSGNGAFDVYVNDGVVSSCDGTTYALQVPGGGGGQCYSGTPKPPSAEGSRRK